MYKEDYIYLVFTQSVDSNFRAFWLAPVTRSIHGYSLFSERRGKWRVVSRKFQNKKLKKRFLSIWFGKYYNSYPPQGRWRTVDIYLDASRLGIYPPLFTSPSGDSCMLFIFSDNFNLGSLLLKKKISLATKVLETQTSNFISVIL